MRKLLCLGLFFLVSFNVAKADFTPANRPYDALQYTITFEVDPGTDPKEFHAELEMKAKATTTLETLSLDIEGLTIGYVQMTLPQKQPLKFDAQSGKELKVTFVQPVSAGQTFTLQIAYAGKIDTANGGLFKVRDPDEAARGPLLFTQLEPIKARAFFPCNDEPYDKAITEIKVSVPARYDVVSNGKKVKEKKFRRGDVPWREVHWKQEKPHPTYLVALAIAPFAKVATKHKGKEVAFYTGENTKGRIAFGMDATRKSLEFMESYLGVPYPWAQYASVGLPTFLWSGMENTSVTFMNQDRMLLTDPSSPQDKLMVVGLTAHELAHQWFGDFVTMKWWDNVWLNESFANHIGTLATKSFFKNEGIELEVVTSTWENYFRQEDGPRSHPIINKALTAPEDAFDSISYTKGQNVLRMLSYYVGEEKFRLGLKAYLTQNAFANADYNDFFSAMEKASGKELGQFRDTWLLQRGYPVLRQTSNWDDGKKAFTFTLAQQSNHSTERSIFHFRVPVVFRRKSAPAFAKSVDFLMEGPRVSQTITLPAEPEWVTVNPGGIALAKVLPEEGKEASLSTLALNDPDATARTWAAFTILAPLREGKTLNQESEALISQMLRQDPSPYVRASIASHLKILKARWVPDGIGATLAGLGKEVLNGPFEKSNAFSKDPHGWRLWRGELTGALGKVNRPEVLPLLAGTLGRENVTLDDLSEAASAVARLGNERSAAILKTTMKLHGGRGYRYRFAIKMAFGALATPGAAQEIREMTKTSDSDLFARIGVLVRDNQVLLESSEWAAFLKEFVLDDTKFGDEIKARILTTIEEVKTRPVRGTLEAIYQQSSSDRLREVSKKILDKNFSG